MIGIPHRWKIFPVANPEPGVPVVQFIRDLIVNDCYHKRPLSSVVNAYGCALHRAEAKGKVPKGRTERFMLWCFRVEDRWGVFCESCKGCGVVRASFAERIRRFLSR